MEPEAGVKFPQELAGAASKKPGVWSQLILILGFGLVLMFSVAVMLVGLETLPLAFSFAGYLFGVFLTVVLMRRGFPHSCLGTGNFVTLIRLALVAALLAPILGTASHFAVISIALVSLVLDGVDGWFARREGRVSSFGARLDIEVDSGFAMVLALNSWAIGTTGPLIVLFALPRYVYMAFAQFFPWLNQPLPSRIGGKVVGVIQIVALIVLNLPDLNGALVGLIILVVSIGLIWSFGRDVLLLYKTRKASGL